MLAESNFVCPTYEKAQPRRMSDNLPPPLVQNRNSLSKKVVNKIELSIWTGSHLCIHSCKQTHTVTDSKSSFTRYFAYNFYQ